MEIRTAIGRWVLDEDGIARDKTYGRDEINLRARIDEHEEGDNFILSWDEPREDKDGKYRATVFQGCPIEIARQIVGVPEDDGDEEKEALKARVGELEVEREKLRQRYESSEMWYGTRWKTLHALLKDADPELFKRACDIMANGSELHVPPTYDQQHNMLKFKKERLEKYLVDFRDECKQFSDKDKNAFLLCHDLMEDIDSFLKTKP
jgi:hypothetical protein